MRITGQSSTSIPPPPPTHPKKKKNQNFLVNKQISQVLEWEWVLNSFQSGFHKVHSTETTLLKVSNIAFEFMSCAAFLMLLPIKC